ncbi:hypothetical protein ACHHYP_03810 [Achlya hypogyna]|uniref:JmjC domain-containing protein n=1 Tax=Achlya hypogyna TaxID=1202772 RepID=A0A1V9Z2T9_ACHHY|nr:hypothetical protein ACHHYP_03810 [Achlya hypogyna]
METKALMAINRGGRPQDKIWDEFSKSNNAEVKDEVVSQLKTKRAWCMWCNHNFKADVKRMRKHVVNECQGVPESVRSKYHMSYETKPSSGITQGATQPWNSSTASRVVMKRKATTVRNTKPKAAKPDGTATVITEADTSEYPILDEDNILAKLVHPMSVADFMATHFRQKALVVHASADRYASLIESGMCNLDVEALLEATSSEELMAWVQTKDKKIESVKVDTVPMALTLHRAGHSLYMRASEELSSLLIPALAKDLGMGFATTSVFGELNGEIEIFCGKAGHTTDWHFDFMENFTVQLQGTKTWRLKKSTVPHPLRGCTPHYKTQDVVEQQLKLHRMADPAFPYHPDVAADGSDVVSVTLTPGSMLYFPGGMWHRVECADDEDSISMNLSMFSTPYADVVADAVRQLLLQTTEGRAGIYYDSVPAAHAHVAKVLADLQAQLASLAPADILPERLLLRGRSGQLHPDNGDDDENDDENSEENSEAGGDAEDHDHDHDHDGCGDHDEEDDDEDESEEEQTNVVDLSSPALLENESVAVARTARFRRNPLASIIAYADIPAIHLTTQRSDVPYPAQLFLLNVGFGHSSYASSMRVEFIVSEDQVPVLAALQATTGPFQLQDVVKPPRRSAQVLVHFLCHAGFLTQIDQA